MLIIHHDQGMLYGRRAYQDHVRKDQRVSITQERYAIGHEPPRYPMPALPLRDLEYIYLENELAKCTLELRMLRGNTIQ